MGPIMTLSFNEVALSLKLCSNPADIPMNRRTKNTDYITSCVNSFKTALKTVLFASHIWLCFIFSLL